MDTYYVVAGDVWARSGTRLNVSVAGRGVLIPQLAAIVGNVTSTLVSDQFGGALSMAPDGSTLLVGAFNQAFGDARPGTVYSFSRGGSTGAGGGAPQWTAAARLIAEDWSDLAEFGSALAFVGQTGRALIGASAALLAGTDTGEGGVYVWAPTPTGPAGPDAAVIGGATVGALAAVGVICGLIFSVVGGRRAREALRKRGLRRDVFGGGSDIDVVSARNAAAGFNKVRGRGQRLT